MADRYVVNSTDLKAVADKIRELTKTSASLSFPNGMVAALDDVTAGGSGKVIVNVESGSVVTATKGTTVATATSVDGVAYVYLPEDGTYTIVASKDGQTTPNAKTVTCPYEVSLSYIDSTLNNNDWGTIRAISDKSEGENYWNVGDTKSITISGNIGNTNISQTINAFIIGFNHNSGKEGNNRIHFLIGKSGDNMCGMTDSQYNTQVSASGWCSMNKTNSNSGGWQGSQMRNTFLGNSGTPTEPVENTFLAALPADLRAEMKSCTKYSDNTGGTSNPASAVTATTDYLFALAEFEVFGTRSYANTAEQNSQVQYAYFMAGNSKVAGSWGSPATAVFWWLRSVFAGYSSYFCLVFTSGAANNNRAADSYGVLPGFCV